MEDNRVNQVVAAGLLKRMGCRVTIANDGREAVDITEDRSFDLVLMDVHMPGMNGCDATRAIRQRETETGKHLYIVAMTASAMAEDRDECLVAGMDDFQSKPIDPKSFQRLMTERFAKAA